MDDDAFVAARVPLFAAAWMASAVAWSVVLVLDSGVGVPAVLAALAAQAVVLVAMGVGVRRAQSPQAAHYVAVIGCVVLGWIVLALFAGTAGLRDVLGVMLLTLYSVPAFAPPSEQFGKLPEAEFFKKNPYAEWYYNTVNVGDPVIVRENSLEVPKSVPADKGRS